MNTNIPIRFTISGYVVGLAALCLASSFVCAQVDNEPMTPEQTIARLVTPRRGRTIPLGITALREEVKANPQVYALAIAKHLELPAEDTASISRNDARTLSIALGLARLIGREHGELMVRQFYDAVWDRLRSCRRRHDQKVMGDANRGVRNCLHLVLLRDAALEVLTEFEDAYAINVCLSSLEAEQKRMTAFVTLQYLEKVAPLRPDFRPKLEEMYNSPSSPLRNHPQLLRVLEAIDKAVAERRLEHLRDNKNERERNKDE